MEYLAQSAFAQSPAAAGLDLLTEIIVCTPYSNIAEYQGTRAAIEAEGIIPVETKWPEGFDELRWEDGEFRYRLRRERPDGVKGPRKQFIDLNWWMVSCDPLNSKPAGVRSLERKTKELADIIYRQSAKGLAWHDQQWKLFWAAKNDEKFQAFKALIPGINRPKGGRRPKNAEQSEGEAA